MTSGEITDQAPDYRPDGGRGPDLTRSYRGQCNTGNDVQYIFLHQVFSLVFISPTSYHHPQPLDDGEMLT